MTRLDWLDVPRTDRPKEDTPLLDWHTCTCVGLTNIGLRSPDLTGLPYLARPGRAVAWVDWRHHDRLGRPYLCVRHPRAR
jgi:hypothetical protein